MFRVALLVTCPISRSACWKYVFPQKYCQYVYSSQLHANSSSEHAVACCRYCNPAIKRSANQLQRHLNKKSSSVSRSFHCV